MRQCLDPFIAVCNSVEVITFEGASSSYKSFSSDEGECGGVISEDEDVDEYSGEDTRYLKDGVEGDDGLDGRSILGGEGLIFWLNGRRRSWIRKGCDILGRFVEIRTPAQI